MFGKSVLKGSSAFSTVGVIGGMMGDRCKLELAEEWRERLEGLRGTVGDMGVRMGELGRL